MEIEELHACMLSFRKNNGTFSVNLLTWKNLTFFFAGTNVNNLFDIEKYVPSAKQENVHALWQFHIYLTIITIIRFILLKKRFH